MRIGAQNGLGLSLADETPVAFPSALSPKPRGIELSQLCAHARGRRQSAMTTRQAAGAKEKPLPALVADSGSSTSSTESGSENDDLVPFPAAKPLPLRRNLSALPLGEKLNQDEMGSVNSSDEEFGPTLHRGRVSTMLTARVASGGRSLGLKGVSMDKEGDRYTTPFSSFSCRKASSAPTERPPQQQLTHAAGLGRGLPRRPTVSMSNTSPPSSSDESWGSSGTTVMRSTSSPSPPSSPVPMLAIELTITPPTPKMKTDVLPVEEQRQNATGRVHSVSLRSSAAPPPQEAYRYPNPMARYYAHTLFLPPPPFDVAPGRNIKLHDRLQHERDQLQLLLDAQQVIEQRLQEHHYSQKAKIHPGLSGFQTDAAAQTPLPPRVVRTARTLPLPASPPRGSRSISTLVPGTPRYPSSSTSNSLPRRVPSQRLVRPMAPSSSDEDDFATRSAAGERGHNFLSPNRLATLRALALASSTSASSDSASSDEDSDGAQKRRLARTNMLRRLRQRADPASP